MALRPGRVGLPRLSTAPPPISPLRRLVAVSVGSTFEGRATPRQERATPVIEQTPSLSKHAFEHIASSKLISNRTPCYLGSVRRVLGATDREATTET